MTCIPDIDENGINRNLKVRYDRDEIYVSLFDKYKIILVLKPNDGALMCFTYLLRIKICVIEDSHYFFLGVFIALILIQYRDNSWWLNCSHCVAHTLPLRCAKRFFFCLGHWTIV